MTFGQELTLLVFTPAVAISVVGFVAKGLFSQLLSRDLERFKAHVQQRETEHKAELDRAAADYRAQLDRIAFEHQTRFSKLHEKRAEVIAELHSRIGTLEYQFWSLTIDYLYVDKIDKEMAGEIENSVKELRKYKSANSIFLEKPVCDAIRSFLDCIEKARMNALFSKAITEDSMSRIDECQRLLRPISTKLESDFRTILGVSNETEKTREDGN